MLKRLLVADDSALAKSTIRRLLADRDDWQVCAEAADGVEAVEKAKALSPDLAIVDIVMPRMNGIEAARQIVRQCKKTAVLVISTHDPKVFGRQIMEAGVRGFVSKSSICSDLIPAIEAVLHGGTYFKVAVAKSA